MCAIARRYRTVERAALIVTAMVPSQIIPGGCAQDWPFPYRTVGDAKSPRRILEAIHEGHRPGKNSRINTKPCRILVYVLCKYSLTYRRPVYYSIGKSKQRGKIMDIYERLRKILDSHPTTAPKAKSIDEILRILSRRGSGSCCQYEL